MQQKKKYYVARGGRNIVLVQDYGVAVMITNGDMERVKEFTNYHLALRHLDMLVKSGLEHSQKPMGEFITVDSSVDNHTGTAEYRIMKGSTQLYAAKNLQYCNPNLAEFLALVQAYRIKQQFGMRGTIYADSHAAVSWFKGEKPLTIPPNMQALNKPLVGQIEADYEYIKGQPEGYAATVEFWDKSMWGEIPADYGRKH